MSERQRSITAEARTAAWLIDRDGFVLAQSAMARRLLGDLSGLEARAILADRDPGGISVRMLGWCLALGERHAAVFGGRSLVMQPVGSGVLVTFEGPHRSPREALGPPVSHTDPGATVQPVRGELAA